MTDAQKILAFEMRRQGARHIVIAAALEFDRRTIDSLFRGYNSNGFQMPPDWTSARVEFIAKTMLSGAVA